MKKLVNEMYQFCKNHKGTVYFNDMKTDREKWMFVFTDTCNYFSKMKTLSSKEVINRAKTNADSHKKDNYEVWIGKHIVIN